ncbi:hypothetical protein ACMD2_07727 [Ananas comosus]|uniref:Uncharacterized protein n=1 Tax=Ananas comosus TaxID=4615 RepID=A0A199V9M3_ANACO|nr:hypothetical protein ACMD2_07727 [Ananas comosus]
MGDRSRPLIVAMKGHPGTGKSTLARGAAAALRLPLLDKDDVRDCTLPLQQSPSPSPSPSQSQSQSQTLGGGGGVGAASLNELSYAVLWRVAETQLRLGLSVVVDSPLSRAAHLAALRRAAARCGGARIAIVECRPGRELEWRRRLEERGAAAASARRKEEAGEEEEEEEEEERGGTSRGRGGS